MSGSPVPFSGVVLAGGRSTRMGVDKASLRLPDGQVLLLRQLELLASLAPARLFVSARQGQMLPPLPPDVERVDDAGESGPLGGIVATLRRIETPRLLVLAVDLPRVDARALRPLLASTGPGAVPELDDHLEPLAAVYPRAWLPHAEGALERRELSLQRLLRRPSESALFAVVPAANPDAFLNWNFPPDLPGGFLRHP